MRLLAAVAFSLAAVASGCGGEENAGETRATSGSASDVTSSAGSPPSERAAYIAKADAFCAQAVSGKGGREISRSIAQLRKARNRPGFFEKAASHYRKVLNFARKTAREFKAIEPPPADEERIEEFNRANDEAIARLEDAVRALERRRGLQQAFEAYAGALAKADRLAEAYGFEVCSRISGR